MNGINQEEVSNQSTLENYTLGYCWYPEQEYYSWCPSDLPKKTIHPDPGKFWFFEGLEIFLIRNMEFVKLCPEKELYSWCPSDLPKNTIHSDPGKFWFFGGTWKNIWFEIGNSWNCVLNKNFIHGVPQTYPKKQSIQTQVSLDFWGN